MTKGFHSIHSRLFLLFLFCMAGILLIVSLLYYNRTTVQLHNKIGDLSRKNVAQTGELFNLLLESYNGLTKTIVNNTDLLRALGEPETPEPAIDLINERTITTLIGAIYYSRDDLIGIHVMTDNGKIYNYGNYMNVVDPDYTRSDWYKRLAASTGKMEFLGVFPQSIIDRMEGRPVFAFGRRIFDLNEHKPIGMVLFETKPDRTIAAMNNLRLGPNSTVYLLSEQDKLMASTSSAVTSGPVPELDGATLPTNDRDVLVDQRDGNLIVASKLPVGSWTIVSVTPDKDLNVELAETKRFLLVDGAILVLVSILIAFIVSRTISAPLKRVILEMRQVENGNFHGELKVSSYLEINLLTASFNHMVRRIADLIERVKLSSVSEKNAELHALQTQVNPHFLYNTLDMIYWMLDEKGNDKLGEVVLSLSHMFRYSSHWKDGAEVTLREEMEQIRHYLTIIQMRLEGRLTVELDIDERWMGIPLPKMTLQPIIENAVKHGLEPLNRPGLLRVTAVEDGQRLLILIEDNGVGMDQTELTRLLRSLDSGAQDEAREGAGGIGLQNLHRRLQYTFGENYGVDVRSVKGEGTTVIVPMPKPAALEGGAGHEHSDRG